MKVESGGRHDVVIDDRLRMQNQMAGTYVSNGMSCTLVVLEGLGAPHHL